MDIDFAITNLDEAREHLENLVQKLKKSGKVGEIDGLYLADMLEIYWHINKVWNTRKIPQIDIDNASQEQIDTWFRFPTDMEDM